MMYAGTVLLSWFVPCLLAAEPVALRIDTDQARAVLEFADGKGDWSGVASTEAYIRLQKREASVGRVIADADFRHFAGSPGLRSRVPALRAALDLWSRTDVDPIASSVLRYLPPQARIRATVYIVIKPRSNNFVFEASKSPAVFLSLDPAANREEFENTVVHELHHIGLASLAGDYERAYASLKPNVRAAMEWLGAFGEGIAMLAAAGGPDIHPQQHSSAKDRARWDKTMANFATDLRKVEAFLLAIVRGRLDEAQRRDRGMLFFGDQGPWYTVGWKMAATVEKEFGRDALIACMQDWRLLLVWYNEAARRLNLPLWSAELTAVLAAP